MAAGPSEPADPIETAATPQPDYLPYSLALDVYDDNMTRTNIREGAKEGKL